MVARPSSRGRRQRGSALVVSMIALTGLVALGTLTILSVQSGVSAAGHDRHKTAALYAAESGAAAAMVALRDNRDWTPIVNGTRPLTIAGNRVRPGQPGNLFAPDARAWYEVVIENNRDDPGWDPDLPDQVDRDSRVLIRATGYGPNGAVAQIEWQVSSSGMTTPDHCPGYGQKGMAEDGAGRNDCLGTIVATDTATYSPGGP